MVLAMTASIAGVLGVGYFVSRPSPSQPPHRHLQ